MALVDGTGAGRNLGLIKVDRKIKAAEEGEERGRGSRKGLALRPNSEESCPEGKGAIVSVRKTRPGQHSRAKTMRRCRKQEEVSGAATGFGGGGDLDERLLAWSRGRGQTAELGSGR